MTLTTFLHGDLEVLANHLEYGDGELSQDEIKSTLANLCRRVLRIEQRREDDDRELERTVGG